MDTSTERKGIADGRFGLATNVSEAVTGYYDLLFDHLKEFIREEEDGALGYEQENAQLEIRLAAGGLDQSEEKSIRDTMRIGSERVTEINEFLNSGIATEIGIDFVTDILDNAEPGLTNRFNAAPISEKYAYLVNHYMEEYRQSVEARVEASRQQYAESYATVYDHLRTRPSAVENRDSSGAAVMQWNERSNTLQQESDRRWDALQESVKYAGMDALVEIDAFHIASQKTKQNFPDIARGYAFHRRQENLELLETDPVKLHDRLMEQYTVKHIVDAGQRISILRHECDDVQSRMEQHEAAQPDWMENFKTLGQAGKIWQQGMDSLLCELDGLKSAITDLEALRADCRGPRTAELAKDEIASLHPDVVDACKRHEAQRWDEANAERLEKQQARIAERESGSHEQSQNSGLSR